MKKTIKQLGENGLFGKNMCVVLSFCEKVVQNLQESKNSAGTVCNTLARL